MGSTTFRPIKHLRSLAQEAFFHCVAFKRAALLTLFVLSISLSACVSNKTEYASGTSFATMQMHDEKVPIVYPMRNPSITAGQEVWEQMKCASCHGEGGTSPFKDKPDLSNEFYISHLSPLRMYRHLIYDLPKKEKRHPKFEANDPKVWDLVFYVRSLAFPPLTEKQIAEIKPFFVANCSACHGPEGYGDGPMASGLNPRPANFHQYNRLFDRQDFMVYNHIAAGLFPSAMPAWRGYEDPHLKVVVDEIYLKKLVEFVRQFHSEAGPNPGSWWGEKDNKPLPFDPKQAEDECCHDDRSDKSKSESKSSK